MRRAKREAAGLTDETARKEAKARVRQAQEELRSFIKENSDVLRRDYWRERYDGIPESGERIVEQVRLARASDTFTVIPPIKGDAIKAQSIYKELQKSDVGKHAYEYIVNNKTMVEINYTDEAPDNRRGIRMGNYICVYVRNTRTVRLTTETIIHEAAHAELSLEKQTQWEEAYCFAQELKHRKKQLTMSDLKGIIKTVKKLYPEYPWR